MYEKHTLLSEPELKILRIFFDLEKHYFAELTKKTKLTRPRTIRSLRKLADRDILETKTEANVKYYNLKKNMFVYSTLSLVEYSNTKKFLNKHKTLKRALEMFKENYKDPLITLIFGSYVKNYSTKTSDIDLLLIKEKFSKQELRKVEDVIEIVNGRTGLKISPHLMMLHEFTKGNELVNEVIENHILLEGAELYYKEIIK